MSKIGRNAETGRFVPVEVARKKPATHVVETVRREPPKPAPSKRK